MLNIKQISLINIHINFKLKNKKIKILLSKKNEIRNIKKKNDLTNYIIKRVMFDFFKETKKWNIIFVLIKSFLLISRYLKLAKYNSKQKKFIYSTDILKLKKKIIFNKFKSLKKNKQKTKIQSFFKTKKIRLMVFLTFSLFFFNNKLITKKKTNKIHMFANIFDLSLIILKDFVI